MHKRGWVLAALVAAGCGAAAAQDVGIAWKADLETARVEAEASGRPMLVVFR